MLSYLDTPHSSALSSCHGLHPANDYGIPPPPQPKKETTLGCLGRGFTCFSTKSGFQKRGALIL